MGYTPPSSGIGSRSYRYSAAVLYPRGWPVDVRLRSEILVRLSGSAAQASSPCAGRDIHLLVIVSPAHDLRGYREPATGAYIDARRWRRPHRPILGLVVS